MSTMAPQRRKTTQRQRLLKGVVEVTNRHGYPGANVTAVIAAAGVSRPTFYDYFDDRDDCFIATIETLQGELLAAVVASLADRPAQEACDAAVRALVGYASAAPGSARFLMGESMAGGAGALDIRDRGIDQIARAIEAAQETASAETMLADLDPRILIASTYRMLAMRLRRGEAAISRLTEDLLGWVAAHRRRASERRWQTLTPGPALPRSPHVPEHSIQQMPEVFPAGRVQRSPEEVAENHRLRILHAAAQLAAQKGYAATTLAEITKLARIDGSVFYRHFSSKQEAFAAAHELGFQQVMDVTAKAFFAGEDWPTRSWDAGMALTQLLDENPLVAHVGFVEAYAVGASAVQRIEDSHTAFLFFLQEGLIQTGQQTPPSRVAMEAIISAIFEIIYRQTRAAGEAQIAVMLPQIAHLWLTPFLGVQASDAFIDAQLKRARRRERKATGRDD